MRHEPTSGVDDPNLNYQVTWKSVNDGETHERVFSDRDEGWDFYEDKQNSADSYKATWEHIPA